jgi:hypothetical protein
LPNAKRHCTGGPPGPLGRTGQSTRGDPSRQGRGRDGAWGQVRPRKGTFRLGVNCHNMTRNSRERESIQWSKSDSLFCRAASERIMSQPSIATSVALAASYGEPPIVVDLDETLIRTDLLIESFFFLLASHPDPSSALACAHRASIYSTIFSTSDTIARHVQKGPDRREDASLCRQLYGESQSLQGRGYKWTEANAGLRRWRLHNGRRKSRWNRSSKNLLSNTPR